MKFKPGQEVTPKIRYSEWNNLLDTPSMIFPQFGKIYTVEGYPHPQFDEMLKLEEIEGNFLYWEERFEAVVPAEKIAEDIEAIAVDHG